MFAAESMVRTLINQGVEICFTNPGTSEMHMVAALDRTNAMKSVLCLFEGVATGAADGYGRMTGKPACTLLHLGPGLANGLANLHNARRAFSPVLNIVGDHAIDHRPLDAPLTSDVEAVCAPMSRWVGTVNSPAEISSKAIEAVQQAFGPARGVASLVLPADCAWSTEQADVLPQAQMPALLPIPNNVVQAAAKAISEAKNPVLYIGGTACLEAGLHAAGRIVEKLDCRLVMETFAPRISRGASRVSPTRLGYFAEQAHEDLKSCDLLVVAGSKPPVSFFAYPDTVSELTPAGAKIAHLGGPADDIIAALQNLATLLEAPLEPTLSPRAAAPALNNANDALNPGYVGLSLWRHMPENSVICDDATTSGMGIYPWLENGPDHEWLCLTGGAIGMGMPLAVGAAFAAPDAQVFALCGDGAAAYTLQALWTQAREKQNIITIVFANHSYLVLNFELARVGAGAPGPAAAAMLDLSNPKMDWVQLAEGFGVAAMRANTVGEFDHALQMALKATQAGEGPQLIVAEI